LVRIKQANESNNFVKQSDTAHADWTTYKVKAEMAFRYGNFGEAESAWLKALELTQLFKTDDPRRVYTFECLSSFYLAERNLDKAESYARQALYLTQETCGQNDPRVAVSLNSLVDIYDRAGRWLDAEALCVRMLKIYYKNYGSDHADVGAVANKLALIYHGLGQLDLAELMYERAIPIRAKALGANHPAYQTLLNNYATLLESTNRKEKALLFRGLPSSVNWASFQCQISTIKLSN
jgi:tetratricopeptide (TPR) repeat protein